MKGWVCSATIGICLLSGCMFWEKDTRPAPRTPPYAEQMSPENNALSEAAAINAAVSAVSLRIAVSGQGPFQIFAPQKDSVSPMGRKVIDSLIRMRLSQYSAQAKPLILSDHKSPDGKWTLSLEDPAGKQLFFRKTWHLRKTIKPGE